MKLLLVVAIVVCAGARADHRWSDEKTGTQFLLLDGNSTWLEAHRACRARGWDVFNYEYLTPEEQERFRTSVALTRLSWDRQFVGEPGEREESYIWMSSEFHVVTVNPYAGSASRLQLRRFANESARRAVVEWGPKDRGKHGAVCMYQSHTWEGCSHKLSCVHEQPSGGTISVRFSFYEYGATRQAALARIRDRARHSGSLGGRCELAIEDPYCIPYR